jgi:hypothetical protein
VSYWILWLTADQLINFWYTVVLYATVAQEFPQGYPVPEESAAHLLLFGRAEFIPEICRASKLYQIYSVFMCLNYLYLTQER